MPGRDRGLRVIAPLVPRAAGVGAFGAIDASGLCEALRQAAEECVADVVIERDVRCWSHSGHELSIWQCPIIRAKRACMRLRSWASWRPPLGDENQPAAARV